MSKKTDHKAVIAELREVLPTLDKQTPRCEDAVTKELSEFKWIDGDRYMLIDEYERGDIKRPSVADYLARQRRQKTLDEMPAFEQETINTLQTLTADVASLEFKLMITNGIIAIAVIIAIFLRLL